MTQEDPRGEHALGEGAQHVRAQHDDATVQPVGGRPTHQEEQHERKGLGAEHVPDVRGRPVARQHGERQGHGQHAGTDERGQPTHEEETEVA
jgi:hypothetical protein